MDFVEIDKEYLKGIFVKRKADSYKGTFGQACIIGGSSAYAGAPEFAAESAAQTLVSLGKAAMLSGCGTSVLAVPDFLAKCIYPTIKFSAVSSLKSDGKNIVFDSDEIDSLMRRSTSFAVGTGMGGGDALNIVKYILAHGEQNFVVDADAIRLTSSITDFEGRAVITPHRGEMAELLDIPVEAVRNESAALSRGYAELINAVVLLKGTPDTYISDGTVVLKNSTGNAKLAKGGSGDVLSGVIAGFLAWGVQPLKAAAAGAWLLGRAAELSDVNEYSHLPTDIIAFLPKAIEEFI